MPCAPKDDHGNDSQVQSLRKCLQKIESDGLVDFKLGGHDAERPGQVFNGHSDDMFLEYFFVSDSSCTTIIYDIKK